MGRPRPAVQSSRRPRLLDGRPTTAGARAAGRPGGERDARGPRGEHVRLFTFFLLGHAPSSPIGQF